MKRPSPLGRLWHVALSVHKLTECEHFYSELLGMKVEWRPDADNVYLSGGFDNLALHRAPMTAPPYAPAGQALDHIGFIISERAQVDVWHEFLQSQQVPIVQPPKTHRDGARSFYCRDPEGHLVQLIFHPPLAAAAALKP